MTETLFGHLVNRFSSSPENMATESLVFLFNQSKVAQTSFCKYLSTLTKPLPERIKFTTQNSSDDDSSIPDIVGRDSTGQSVILGESKFWAGLTDNQPVTYLQRLVKTHGIVLVFLSPERRFPTLWPELIRRCNNAKIQIDVQEESPGYKVASINGNQYLVLVSWRSVLDTIRQSLEVENERDTLGNLIQLQGLCDQMDTSAFLPLQSEELTSMIGARLLQYCDIVDEIVNGLESRNIISLQGLRATPIRAGYKRYFRFETWGCSLEFNAYLWKEYRATPLWLGISSEKWKFDAVARQKLVRLELEVPSRIFTEGDTLFIPIFIEIGMERDGIVRNILEQISEVFGYLST